MFLVPNDMYTLFHSRIDPIVNIAFTNLTITSIPILFLLTLPPLPLPIQVKARGAELIVITDKAELAEGLCEDPLVVPHNGPLTALGAVLPLQLIAYELALIRYVFIFGSILPSINNNDHFMGSCGNRCNTLSVTTSSVCPLTHLSHLSFTLFMVIYFSTKM